MASCGEVRDSLKKFKVTDNSQEQIISGFQDLRNQQRSLINKISEIDLDRKEHDLVIETLKEIDSDRKCFRLVGSVLVEKTVVKVLPELQHNQEQLGKILTSMEKQLESKGKELQEYREKYNIRIKGEEEKLQSQDQQNVPIVNSTTGVLVAQDGL